MKNGPGKIAEDFVWKMKSQYCKYFYHKKMKNRLKAINGGYKCDKEYKETVVPYWKKYGYIPSKDWYCMFSNTNHKVDPRYIPDDLYWGELLPYFNNMSFQRYGEDKCYYDVWFSDVKGPKTVCKNIAGIYYDSEMNIINEEKALDLCMNHGAEILIKPSMDSYGGQHISFFAPDSIKRTDVKKAFNDIGTNFIVQEKLKQNAVLGLMNESSLNTIRIISLIFEGEVHILSSILRVGEPGAKVDNFSAGGFAVQIMENGQLFEKGINGKSEWVSENHNGVKFSDIVIPSYDRVIGTVKKQHAKLGHFRLIGWDITVDEAADPVIIEFNINPGTNQVTCGPTFGDLTDKVLDEYFAKRKQD